MNEARILNEDVMDFREPCPSRELLLDLHRGELAESVLAAVCQHLCSCPDCEARLAAIQEGGDDVAAHLRRFLVEKPVVDPEECRKLEANAKMIRVGEAPAPAPQDGSEAPTLPAGLSLPAQLGKYRLTRVLGRGGMGVVYAAVHTKLNKPVAVKVIRHEYADDPRVVARFRREARVVGELSHPNVVTATDADEVDGRHFLVMELVDGIDLETLIRRIGPLGVADACEVIRQAATGLQYVHEKKRVHRDLKPSNLMLSVDGVVKILDLGLAGLTVDQRSGGDLTGSQSAMGTVDYMAPEQWLDSRSVDIRADIYSLGCTLYKLLTGKVPFGGADHPLPAHKQLAHAEAPPPSARLLSSEVHIELDALIRKMMGKTPSERPATPQEVAGALTQYTTGANCQVLAASATESATRHWVSDGLGQISAETATHQSRTPTGAGPRETVLHVRARIRRWRRVVTVACILLAAGVLGWELMKGQKPIEEEQQPAKKGETDQPTVTGSSLRPGTWYPLLKQEPVRLYWQNQKLNHLLDFRPEAQELRVDVPYVGLLGLGKTEYLGYRIQLGIRQSRWVGGVGLFFGYHEDVVDGQQCKKFQLLELKPTQRAPTETFVLERLWLTLRNENQRIVLSGGSGVASANISRPTDREEVILQIEVRPEGLAAVIWDGKPLPELIGNMQNAQVGAADYVGDFGTFNRSSYSIYGNAFLRIYER